MSSLLSTRYWIALILLLTTSFAWAGPRIAIMDFDNKSSYGGWRIGHGASDILTTELVKATDFDIFERDRLNSIMQEQNLGSSGRVNPATAAKIGKIAGVQYIITGAVTEYGQSSGGGGGGGFRLNKKGYYATVDIRIVDVNTSRILMADSGSGTKTSKSIRVFGIGGGERYNEKHATEALRLAIQEVVKKIKDADFSKGSSGSATTPILLADVDGREVVLNAGKGAGLKVGQIMEIKRQGKVIKDPSTGAVLKIRYKTVGKIKLTSVESSYSEGEIIEGNNLKTGDTAK